MSILNQQLANAQNCLTIGCGTTPYYVPPQLVPNKLEVERVDNGYIVHGYFNGQTKAWRREVALDADGLAKILKRWGAGHEAKT